MGDSPHKGHRARLKQRFLKEGLDSFEEHNILELTLFYAIAQKDTNMIAHQLMERFGSLRGVLEAPFEELVKIKGISDNAATLLVLLPQLARAYFTAEQPDRNTVFETAEKLGDYFVKQYVGVTTETVYIMLLDSELRKLGCERVSVGGLTSANLDVRKMIEAAIQHRATGVVLAHNHPNADVSPSNDDVIATSYLKNALSTIDIQLVDHIIVSRKRYVSFKQMGYI